MISRNEERSGRVGLTGPVRFGSVLVGYRIIYRVRLTFLKEGTKHTHKGPTSVSVRNSMPTHYSGRFADDRVAGVKLSL